MTPEEREAQGAEAAYRWMEFDANHPAPMVIAIIVILAVVITGVWVCF